MANRITTLFEFKEQGRGLQRIRADIAGVDGAWNKTRTGFRSAIGEFRQSNTAQAAAIGALGAAAYEAIKLGSELEESINAVNVSYGENAEAVLAIGENAAVSFGMSKSEFNSFAVQFSSFAQQIAKRDGRDVSEVLQEMTQRVVDFGSVMNMDATASAELFMSTLAGETEPIRRFGKDISAAAVEQYALANGLVETKSQLTEAIKSQARYGLLMQETANTAGDFANTSDSLANSQRTATAQAKDFAADLGTELAPALATVVTGLSEMLGVAKDLQLLKPLQWIGDAPAQAEEFGRAVRRFFDDGADANYAYAEAVTAAEQAASDFDATTLQGVTTYEEARKKALEYAQGIDGLGDQADHAANLIANEWYRANKQLADQLKEQATESTYAANAHDELNLVTQAQGEAAAEAARKQEEFLESIKHTRDEVDALKRSIDDRQAFLNLQGTFDDTNAKIKEFGIKSREGELAVLGLREEVLQYAEDINLPDAVVTKIDALIDEGKLADAQAIIDRLGAGITLPIKPQLIGGTNLRVDENGNVRLQGFDTGGVVPGPRGSAQLAVVHGGETILPTHKPGAVTSVSSLSGPTFNITVNAGIGANGAEVGNQIVDIIRQYERRNGTGWRS